MKHAYLPAGRYNARVTKRKTSQAKGGLPTVELTFEVTGTPFAGRSVTGRFCGNVMLERAAVLREKQEVDIDVVLRRDKRGRRFSTVKDFRRAGQPTVVMYVNGVCTTNPANPRQPRCEFGPVSVCTERDHKSLERDRREFLEMGIELPPMPLLDSATLDAITLAISDERGPAETLQKAVDSPSFADVYGWSMLVLGGKAGRRMLVAADETFARYARAEKGLRLEAPAHISVFQYSDDLALHQDANAGSVAGYRGIVWGRWFVIELDDHESTTLRLDACRNLVKALQRLGLTDDQIMVFFSGNTGMHVMFPTMVAGTVPRTNYEYACGHFCQMLIDQATRVLAPPPPWKPSSPFSHVIDEMDQGVFAGSGLGKQCYDPRSEPTWHEPIDWNMYKPNAMLRAPNTRHEASGLYKIRLDIDELMMLDAEAIRRLAATPRPFEAAGWLVGADADLADFWQYATEVADTRPYAIAQVIDQGNWVFADTFDFLHNGAPEGTRAKRVFRAAVNLLQIGCSREAVYQLLSPAALMSGMTPAETRHQLEGAVRYIQKARPPRRDAVFTPNSGMTHGASLHPQDQK